MTERELTDPAMPTHSAPSDPASVAEYNGAPHSGDDRSSHPVENPWVWQESWIVAAIVAVVFTMGGLALIDMIKGS